jgi:hypothetical protein
MRARLPARRPVDHRKRNFHRRRCVKLTIRLGRLAEQAKEREKELLDRLRE